MRHLMHREVSPRHLNISDSIPLNILFCSETLSAASVPFVPNHFVPLVSMRQVKNLKK